MALIDKLLLRGPQETARAEAMREFRRLMPRNASFSELAESGITTYYNKRFGKFEPTLDRWNDSHASALRANPLLRRIDVIADNIFHAGRFDICDAGHVLSDTPPFGHEGMIAAIRLADRAGRVTGVLTLDIGSEIRFSKLRIGTAAGNDFQIRLSMLDGGMTVGKNTPVKGRLPETIHERAEEGSEVFQTIAETIDAIDRILRGILSKK